MTRTSYIGILKDMQQQEYRNLKSLNTIKGWDEVPGFLFLIVQNIVYWYGFDAVANLAFIEKKLVFLNAVFALFLMILSIVLSASLMKIVFNFAYSLLLEIRVSCIEEDLLEVSKLTESEFEEFYLKKREGR